MSSEDYKKRFLNSREYFTARRWEGKPLLFRLKYLWANYPEILGCVLVLYFCVPLAGIYKYYTYPGSKTEAYDKYKTIFRVVRDDHPDIERIIEEKERGRHYFPN